jgi:hypothetical protein
VEKKKQLPELVSHELLITETNYTSLKMLSTDVTVNISKPVFRIG